jgi:hypothetical protein
VQGTASQPCQHSIAVKACEYAGVLTSKVSDLLEFKENRAVTSLQARVSCCHELCCVGLPCVHITKAAAGRARPYGRPHQPKRIRLTNRATNRPTVGCRRIRAPAVSLESLVKAAYRASLGNRLCVHANRWQHAHARAAAASRLGTPACGGSPSRQCALGLEKRARLHRRIITDGSARFLKGSQWGSRPPMNNTLTE